VRKTGEKIIEEMLVSHGNEGIARCINMQSEEAINERYYTM
jgi:hypothetical protein